MHRLRAGGGVETHRLRAAVLKAVGTECISRHIPIQLLKLEKNDFKVYIYREFQEKTRLK